MTPYHKKLFCEGCCAIDTTKLLGYGTHALQQLVVSILGIGRLEGRESLVSIDKSNELATLHLNIA